MVFSLRNDIKRLPESQRENMVTIMWVKGGIQKTYDDEIERLENYLKKFEIKKCNLNETLELEQKLIQIFYNKKNAKKHNEEENYKKIQQGLIDLKSNIKENKYIEQDKQLLESILQDIKDSKIKQFQEIREYHGLT